MAQILPIAAGKAKERSTEAVKGDVYVRKWTSVEGKGKKKRVVEHEIHANPGSIGLTAVGLAVGAGVAVVGGALALRFSGKKLITGAGKMERILRVYDITYKTVVDKAAYVETINHDGSGHWEANTIESTEPSTIWRDGSWIHGTWQEGHYDTYYPDIPDPAGGEHWVVDLNPWVETVSHAAETHEEPARQRAVVFSKRGVPIREWKADSIALEWPQGLSERQFSQGWTFAAGGRETGGSDRLGDFKQIAFIYTNPNRKSFGLEDKSDSKDWLNPLNWFS